MKNSKKKQRTDIFDGIEYIGLYAIIVEVILLLVFILWKELL